MPLNLNETRDRAIRFAHEWSDESSEDAEAKSFWDGFFEVFGISRRRVAAFEAPVRQLKEGGREIRQPSGPYILIPRHSSENRAYIPMGFFGPDVVCGDSNLLIPDASTYHFGVLNSGMHMAWVRYVCGRLESRFRYSNTIVYNNFPWPESPTKEQRAAVEKAAQGVLDARAKFPDSSLADLYDPLAMPRDLVTAHAQLDRTVEAAYGKRFDSDAKRVAFLFERYQKLTALFIEEAKPKRVARGRRKP